MFAEPRGYQNMTPNPATVCSTCNLANEHKIMSNTFTLYLVKENWAKHCRPHSIKTSLKQPRAKVQQDGILSRKFHRNRQHTATVNHQQYFPIHRVTSMIWVVSESLQLCYNCGTTQTILQWCHLNEFNLTKTPSRAKTDRQADSRLCSRRKLSRTESGATGQHVKTNNHTRHCCSAEPRHTSTCDTDYEKERTV